MEYKTEKEVNSEQMRRQRIPEEKIIRDVIYSMIGNIPLEQLKQMFNVEIIDPTYEDVRKAIRDRNSDVRLIERLWRNDKTMYRVKINDK